MGFQENILLFFSSIKSPLLDNLMEAVTILGEQNILIAVIVWIFWNSDKKKGFILSFTLLISLTLNSVIKVAFRAPRPFQVMAGITGKRVSTATGYSFPSGHTQGAATFYPSLAVLFGGRKVMAASILIAALVAVSRVYLGVHWPADVLAGFLLGIAAALVLSRYLDGIYENNRLRTRLLLFSVLAAAAVLVMFDLLNRFTFEKSLLLTDLFKVTGVMTGASAGFIAEIKWTDFSVEAALLKRILRFVAGLSGVLVILAGVKVLLPGGDLFSFVRYLMTGLWITFIFPWIGVRLRLFKSTAGKS